MKAVIQRVTFAKVIVNQQTIAEISQGILVYLGLGQNDTLDIGQKMINKILNYRLFENEHGKLDKNLSQINGELLIVSQFTLLANTHSGRRADFKPAMSPHLAKPLFNEIIQYAQNQYPLVKTGEFGANMQIHSCNDGPINFIFNI